MGSRRVERSARLPVRVRLFCGRPMIATFRERTAVREPLIFEIAEVLNVFDFCTGRLLKGSASQPLPKRG
jgi:hypothetical protein